MLNREELLAETLRLHDLYYGNAHCERKWVEICSKFQDLIYEASESLRNKAKANETQKN